MNEKVTIICNWMTLVKDNILEALLKGFFEEECLAFMGYYSSFLNKDLFLFALSNNNDLFMQKALLMGAFDKTELQEVEVIDNILANFEDGSKTNYILNILLLIGIDVWKNKSLKKLIDMFENFTCEDYLENRLILSYNPLMSIALTAEILTSIANTRKRFRDKCNDMLENLLSLGKMYAGKIEDEDLYRDLISDTDFSGRSVLFIVCECGF